MYRTKTTKIILTLKTVDNDVYARNFKEELVLAFNFSTEFNPDTGDIISYISLIFIISCISIFIIKNTKVKTYVLGIIFMMGFVSFVNADNYIVVKIPGIVSYKSLNILKASGVTYDEGLLDVEQECTYPVKSENFCDVAIKDNSHTVIYDNVIDFWKYASDIQNIYIKNDIVDIKDYEYKFDVTYNDENRVFAYLVTNKNDRKEEWDRFINEGLRARLAINSVITGQLLIELNMLPDTKVVLRKMPKDSDIFEIPTLNSPFAEISKSLQVMPINRIMQNINSLTESLSADVPPFLVKLNAALDTFDTILNENKNSTTRMVNEFGAVAKSMDNLLTDNSASIANTIDSLNEAAQSMKNLTDYLQMYPSAIITGKEY